MNNRKDIEKEMNKLIALRNKYNNEGEYDKVNEVRERIRILKSSLRDISAKQKQEENGKLLHSTSTPKESTIPEIPDLVVINNINITDMLHKLKDSSDSTSANEIYNSIINLCEGRKNYINSVLKKNVNSYDFDIELELSDKAKQAIKSLQNYAGLDNNDIDKKIAEMMNSIDSYNISKSCLKLKANAKRAIKQIKSCESLSKEEISNRIAMITSSIRSYVISKKGLTLKSRVKKQLLNLFDSSEIDKSYLESKSDVRELVMPISNYKELSNEKIDKRVFELLDSIDSYNIDKCCLKLKKDMKKIIASLKTNDDLTDEERNNKILELLNSVDSYNINKNGLELKSKVKQSISSLMAFKNLGRDEINRRISKILDSVDSYDVDKKDLKLKSTLYDEIYYINNIISLSYRLLVDIKRKDIKNVSREITNISLTKKQESILNGIYEKNIPECSIDDYFIAFKYFIDKNEVDKEILMFIVNDFFSRYKYSNEKSHIIESFMKLVKKKIKSFNNNDKRTINSIMRVSTLSNNEVLENDYRYEVLDYFLYKKDKLNIEQLISNMPDIAYGYYDGKSVIVDMFSKVLDIYNTLLCNYRKDMDIMDTIDVFEDTFIKLYNINDSEKKKIEYIINDYIHQLKSINCSTVLKNIILYRLNRIREKMGIKQKISLPEIDRESYRYLDYYYNESISDFERKQQENSIILSGSNTVSYSVLQNNGNTTLKINIVDLTPYFIDGTDLNELAIMDCVDSSKMKKYVKFEVGQENPSITFEFQFYNGVLENSIIYDSVVKPIDVDETSRKYDDILDSINVFNLKSDFNELIKLSLKNNATSIPYIVKYSDEDNKYYKIITDLNYIFSKLNKSDVECMYQIFKRNGQKYGLSSDVVGKMDYDISVLEPACNIYDILMQKIIKSYYNNKINLDSNTVVQYIKM